uniref:DUF1993 family protein n=1 Tax=Phenylobacterium glaciei TaxID=2803784 RepID=A0A974P6J9_9CAUL|nr:DUF1993 family protein [Phenylobacterium glaciei]
MAISLYDVSVTSFLQSLNGVAGFLDRGLSHFTDNNVDPNSIVDVRLFPDMLPFWFQISSVVHHSSEAIDGVRAGTFSPGGAPAAQLRRSAEAGGRRAGLAEGPRPRRGQRLRGPGHGLCHGLDADALHGGGLPDVLLLPNLHFHATTAYDILRMQGVPLGKRDYLGGLRLKA